MCVRRVSESEWIGAAQRDIGGSVSVAYLVGVFGERGSAVYWSPYDW